MLRPETEGYTINWYKENAGRQKLIQKTQRIISQMNFLEFWPAELSDSGNYSVTHRWVHRKWMNNILPLKLSIKMVLVFVLFVAFI